MDYDLVIRGGTVATASAVFEADVAVADGKVAALGHGLGPGRREIDARGRLVLPGGIDSHAHIEQLAASGMMNADTWESATRAAAFGGTTTVIAFAAQHRGMSLAKVVEDYHGLARKGALIDYAFHLILADPTETALKEELPALIEAGHASLKVFMTYDLLQVDDQQLLDVLIAARAHRVMVCVHAENHGMISWMTRRLLERGYTEAKYHAVSHPRLGEAEAFHRLFAMAALIDQPVMVFHVSTAEGARAIRRARGEGLKVYGETCPQYLFLTADDMDRPGTEGAKWICSPPLRTYGDHHALWRGLELGDLQTVSSDHAPYRYDESGKLAAGRSPNFKQVPNGMPGLEPRLPLLFDAMVSKGFMSLERFVDITATAPARIYGLHPQKGTIAIGADADLAVWDPEKAVTFADESVHDRAGYTPYSGRTVRGWPVMVLSRGRIVVEDGELKAEPGSGRFLARKAGPAAQPSGRLSPEFEPSQNFGAELY